MSKRRYETTHPWLCFEVRPEEFTPRLWRLLGEAQSKCEHVAGVPLRPSTARELHLLYLAKGAMATTAIEGNTLSEDEVRARVAGQLHLPTSREYLGREVDNILDLCSGIVDEIDAPESAAPVDAARLRYFNEGVLRGLQEQLEEGVVPGRYVDYQLIVGNYRTAPPQDVPYLVDRLTTWLEQLSAGVDPRDAILWAVVRAVLAHVYFVLIHPFGDGNGRTARMLEFVILIQAGVPSVAAHLLSNHYNRTRAAYYRELSRISREAAGIVPFLEYAVQGFVDQLAEQIARIRQEHLDVAWINYVHDSFRDKTTETARRRKTLVLELSRRAEGVPREDVVVLSSKLAKMYRGKTEKAVTRDLNRVVEMGLVIERDDRYVANTRIVRAFLPMRSVVDA